MSESGSDAAQMIGIEFGPYRIQRLLGEGAFGSVFEAIKQPLGKRVALKILHKRWAENPQVTERFLQEARAAASLRHPHIVDVDDIGQREGVPWIAMEFLEGESLASRLDREGRMSIETTLEYVLPIFSAVAAIHDKNIIHRDLKPENIQLWQGSAGAAHPKLLDFGIAKIVNSTTSGHSLTGATEIMGTPEYMAPEQWRSAKLVDPASDQWALAVITYRLLTGISPFDGDSPQSVMFAATMQPPPPFDGELATHTRLESVLHKALQKDPRNRFASVRAFAAELLPFSSVGTQQRWRTEFGGSSSGFTHTIASPDTIAVIPRATPAQKGGVSTDSLIATSDVVAPKPKSNRTAMIAAGAVIVGLVGVGALVKALGSSSTSTSTTVTQVGHGGENHTVTNSANTAQHAVIENSSVDAGVVNTMAVNESVTDAGAQVIVATNNIASNNSDLRPTADPRSNRNTRNNRPDGTRTNSGSTQSGNSTPHSTHTTPPTTNATAGQNNGTPNNGALNTPNI